MPAMDQDKAASYRLALRHALAVNVRRLRSARGWSQEVLAFESGLHRTFVAHVERAARNISLDNIARLAVALEVTAAALLELPPPNINVVNGKS